MSEDQDLLIIDGTRSWTGGDQMNGWRNQERLDDEEQEEQGVRIGPGLKDSGAGPTRFRVRLFSHQNIWIQERSGPGTRNQNLIDFMNS